MKQNSIVLIRDGLHLEYGYFQTKHEFSHVELIRGYNIYGEPLVREQNVDKQYRILRSGDGITTFKSQIEMDKFLSQIGPYKIFAADLIHRKFFSDRDTLLGLSD